MSYEPRRIEFLGLQDLEGWRSKLYGICQEGSSIDGEFQKAMCEIGRRVLPQPSETDIRYGCAFLTVHVAAPFNQVLVDWWEFENELRHRVFRAPPGSPLAFQDITSSGESFCVWELRVLAHEREAWIRNVLVPREKNLDAYLADTLCTIV